MRSIIASLVGLAALGWAHADAALVSMGQYTLDTGTNLEWLNPTLTLGLAYSAVLAGEGGWTTSGWRTATVGEFVTLTGEYIGPPALNVPGYFETAKSVVLALGADVTLNDPQPNALNQVDTFGSFAFEQIIESSGYLSSASSALYEGDIIAWYVQPGVNIGLVTSGGVDYRQDVDGDMQQDEGTFLVRSAIPEPSTYLMMLLGFAGLGYATRRRVLQRL